MWRTYYVDPADADRLEMIAAFAAYEAQRPSVADVLRVADHLRNPAALARVSRALEVELHRGKPS